MTAPLTGERLDPPSTGRVLAWPFVAAVVVMIGLLIGVSFDQRWLTLSNVRAEEGFTLKDGQRISRQDAADVIRKTYEECIATKANGRWPLPGNPAIPLTEWCKYLVQVGGCVALTGATKETCTEAWRAGSAK
jgi:hypothetical protein